MAPSAAGKIGMSALICKLQGQRERREDGSRLPLSALSD